MIWAHTHPPIKSKSCNTHFTSDAQWFASQICIHISWKIVRLIVRLIIHLLVAQKYTNRLTHTHARTHKYTQLHYLWMNEWKDERKTSKQYTRTMYRVYFKPEECPVTHIIFVYFVCISAHQHLSSLFFHITSLHFVFFFFFFGWVFFYSSNEPPQPTHQFFCLEFT